MILNSSDWQRSAAPAVDPALWTAVIPAAGRGTRLGFHRPKILFPVAGRMIVEWLLDFLSPHCRNLVFVLSPDGRAEVEKELDRLIPGRYRTVIQQVPTGMGDAVALGLDAVETPFAAVVWGDQVALRRASVEACMRLQQGPLAPALTCPTVLRPSPYIHFERDEAGRISRLLQAREGDSMPAEGESDTGFFCLRPATVLPALAALRSSQEATGGATKEFNFLPVIPVLARQATVLTPRLMSLEETVGVNSSGDADQLEHFLLENR